MRYQRTKQVNSTGIFPHYRFRAERQEAKLKISFFKVFGATRQGN